MEDKREKLLKKLENEQNNKKKMEEKKKSIELKINKIDQNIKRINDEVESYDVKCTINLIKAKGYSLSYVNMKIKEGVLEKNEQNRGEV